MKTILTILLSGLALCASAQDHIERLGKKVDSVLTVRYNKVSYDTAFIGRPQHTLTLKLRANLSGNSLHARGEVDGVNTKADLSTDHKATISIGGSYRGVTAGLAINPSHLKGRNKDFELNANLFTNRYSLDLSYQVSKTLSGNMWLDDKLHYIDKGFNDFKMLNLAGYYTFNYRRFSYPAAFTQSYIQKRSAGSWLVGFSYLNGRLKTNSSHPADLPSLRIYMGHFGIGGGYAYNWVVRDRWLFHISALPTLVLYNRNNITIDGVRRDMDTKFPDLIFNHRVAIVRNFSDRYFAGATLVISTSLFQDNDVMINQNKWRTRAFFGFRL